MRAALRLSGLLFAALALGLGEPARAEDRRTGYDDMGAELQAMQNDPMANPGLFWVLEGERLYGEPTGDAGASCADCHGPGDAAMAGIAARYPSWDGTLAAALDLSGRINRCRAAHQQADPLAHESETLIALNAYVTHQSRGLPIAPDPSPEMDVVRAEGRALYDQRLGQLNLACAHCHTDHAGGRLAAALIPEAHPTGYPQYRLQWETMGTLHRRFGACMNGVRARTLPPGSRPLIALEAYLKERAAGLLVETLPIRP